MKGFDSSERKEKGPFGPMSWPTGLDTGPYGDEVQSIAKRLLVCSDEEKSLAPNNVTDPCSELMRIHLSTMKEFDCAVLKKRCCVVWRMPPMSLHPNPKLKLPKKEKNDAIIFLPHNRGMKSLNAAVNQACVNCVHKENNELCMIGYPHKSSNRCQDPKQS